MRMTSGVRLLAALFFVTTVTLAASTRFVSTWRNPLAGPVGKSGQKVAAFIITAEESMRLGPEESLAAEMRLRGVDCLAGYTVLPGELARDQAKAREFLAKAGITGAIIMRVVGEAERQQTYASATAWSSGPYPGFWSYWGYSWEVVYSPGYMRSDKVFAVETLVYSIEKDELVWGGISETTNPKDIRKFIKDLINEAAKEMRKAGLLKE